MADPTTLLALAARAEAGGDMMLSDDVWRHLGWVSQVTSDGVNWRSPASNYEPIYGNRPNLLTSIDAQAELPGRIVEITVHDPLDEPGAFRALASLDMKRGPEYESYAPTESLARLSAKLRAMAAMKDSDHG